MKKINFDSSIFVRISKSTKKEIKELVAEHPDLYNNEAHLVRCAVIRLINKHNKGAE